MDAKTTNILYYCTFIGWIIAVIAGDQANSSLNHKNQGFVIGIVGMIFGVVGNVMWWIPVLGIIVGILFNIVNLIMFIYMIAGLTYAATDQDKLLPFICAIRIFNE